MNPRDLPEGKLPISVLGKILHTMNKGGLLVPPEVGVDIGVWKSRGRFIVSSSDPITGAGSRIGWHAVNVSVNDVATSGIMPEALNIVALFPSGTTTMAIRKVISEINKTARNLGVSVAGGHTEITPGLSRPIVTVTAIGSGNRFVTAADARAGDVILMTKTAGIEGTAILSKLSKVRGLVGAGVADRGANLIKRISILKEAKLAFQTGKVHAMHDVTEGGVLGAVYEMSIASRLGFILLEEAIPVDKSTREICSKLAVDPIRLIGSGALIIACKEESESLILNKLHSNGIRCSEIGRYLQPKEGRRLEKSSGTIVIREREIQDELWETLRKHGDLS
ncbi:MAG: hypothetical protein JRN15_03790 [Nitrososphaerota archaeon]|nr:hypothetical protein [Nitrososphaerota archaeon]